MNELKKIFPDQVSKIKEESSNFPNFITKGDLQLDDSELHDEDIVEAVYIDVLVENKNDNPFDCNGVPQFLMVTRQRGDERVEAVYQLRESVREIDN